MKSSLIHEADSNFFLFYLKKCSRYQKMFIRCNKKSYIAEYIRGDFLNLPNIISFWYFLNLFIYVTYVHKVSLKLEFDTSRSFLVRNVSTIVTQVCTTSLNIIARLRTSSKFWHSLSTFTCTSRPRHDNRSVKRNVFFRKCFRLTFFFLADSI